MSEIQVLYKDLTPDQQKQVKKATNKFMLKTFLHSMHMGAQFVVANTMISIAAATFFPRDKFLYFVFCVIVDIIILSLFSDIFRDNKLAFADSISKIIKKSE